MKTLTSIATIIDKKFKENELERVQGDQMIAEKFAQI